MLRTAFGPMARSENLEFVMVSCGEYSCCEQSVD